MFFCVFGGGGSGSAAPAISGATRDDLVETMVRVWARGRRGELARECEQRHWTGNTCLHCSSMGESLIVFVKSDREPRILEIVSDSGAKSDPKPQTPETASDFGAKSVPEPQILEIVSDSGAKLDPKLRILEIVSDSGSKSDPKLDRKRTR